MSGRHAGVSVLPTIALAWTCSLTGASLPNGFSERPITQNLASPTATEFAADGRLFVCEKGGAIRIIKNDVLLATPFATVTTRSDGELGLLGITLDPNFPAPPYVYVLYTVDQPTPFHRVVRITANGDVAVPGSETVIFNLDPLISTYIVGGGLRYGLDGKLYIATARDAANNSSQSMTNLLGKLLRINPDGTIPTDNPFYNSASGKNRAIWTLGLRNAFGLAVQPGTGKIFINDVGESSWEEINEGVAGANYGWPIREGYSSDPNLRSPRFSYPHGVGATSGCAITGGTFYKPSVQFPSSYNGVYFFADYCNGWIRTFNPANSTVTPFATGYSTLVSLAVSPQGSLYVISIGGASTPGSVTKVEYMPGLPPQITEEPMDVTIPAGQLASFSVSASGSHPLSHQWKRNGSTIAGATSSTYALPASTSDNGALFVCTVSNVGGATSTRTALLTVSSGSTTLPSGPNLLSDPGFEGGGAAWQRSTFGGRAVVTTQAHTGSRSQQIAHYAGAVREVYQDIAVTGGNDYVAAGWVKVGGVGSATRVILQWLNGAGLPLILPAGVLLQVDLVGALGGTQGWTQVSGVYTSPAGAVVARLILHADVESDGSATSWFDDMVFARSQSNGAPTATIVSPVSGATYKAGDTITYSGTGTDPEDGTLAASAFTWQIDFHHDTHLHPALPPTSGAKSGSITVPNIGHTETNVWFRFRLTVTDSAGATHTVTRDVYPQLVTITLQTSPPGRALTLDGIPVVSPVSQLSVKNMLRTLEAVTPQTSGTTTYTFNSWSDGGAATHTIATPQVNTTYTAVFNASGGGGPVNLIQDPGFESGGTGWQKTTLGGRAVVTTQAHSGTRSQQISVSAQYPREVYQDVAVQAGLSYLVSGWIKSSGVGPGAVIEIEWLNAAGLPAALPAGALIRKDIAGVSAPTQGWVQALGTYTAPAGAVVGRIRLSTAPDPDNTGFAWFDDFQVVAQ